MAESIRPHPSGRARLVRLAVLLLATACLVATGPGASAVGDGPQRWSGYRISSTGQAAGGWIGGYRVDGARLYLTTPTRKPNRSGFASGERVSDVAGRTASRSETERAAWILSKYGDYADPTQSAAVDATLYHLLVGKTWRIGSPRGSRRIRQSGDPASVRRFARFMLRQSRHSAGEYTARLDASGADLGGSVTVTLSVLDGHGRPAAGLPVTLDMGGAAQATSVTGDDGRAVARFAANARGWQTVTATVGNVPEHRLHLWTPRFKAQAAAAEGGVRRTLVVSTQTAVRGSQTLSLAADPGQLVVGSTARVVATVAGDGVPRTATATLFGPFATAASVGCTGPSAGSVSSSVSTDGGHPMPGVVIAGGGYYAWRVAVDGTATSVPVSGCGGTVKALSRPGVAITWSPAPPAAGENVLATATVFGIPFPAEVKVRISLYQDEVCGTALLSSDLVLLGNGNVSSSFAVRDPNIYSWRAETSPGDLWVGATSSCRVMTVK